MENVYNSFVHVIYIHMAIYCAQHTIQCIQLVTRDKLIRYIV